MRATVLLATLSLAPLVTAGPTQAGTRYHWVQHVAGGGIEARAVTDGGACPPAALDGTPATMTERAVPSDAFPVRVCSLPVPAGVREAAVDGVPLSLPSPRPRRVLVLGDTGCRMKGTVVQACDDPVAWPFRALADNAALLEPDLVVHVGDYHYRETACPVGDRGCAGSPFGDDWGVWEADFFAPAASLLGVAPWLAVRGNHETCDRGGHGWSRFLDPGPFDPATGCAGDDPALPVDLGGLTLYDVDTAALPSDEGVDPARAAHFREEYGAIAARTAGPVWLVQHRPLRGFVGAVGDREAAGGNATLASVADALPEAVRLVVSGHIHAFQVLDFADPRLAPQLVVGHGGDRLDEGAPADLAGLTIDGAAVAGGAARQGFGFLLLERRGEGVWSAQTYDVRGQPLGTACAITDRHVGCGQGRLP